MDADSAIFLVDNGAKIEDSVFLTFGDGSTLHELYRSKVCIICWLLLGFFRVVEQASKLSLIFATIFLSFHLVLISDSDQPFLCNLI